MLVIILAVWLQFTTVHMSGQYEKPVTMLSWRGKCHGKQLALNDCNWCRCNIKSQYSCDARKCEAVDMFGHFNDHLQEFDNGMEGHGSWRSTSSACEPNVTYRRAGLMCVCNEDGVWPNPVCRDTFRVLHLVEESEIIEANGQKCSAGKLYLVGCHVCFCSPDGNLDPKFCTKQLCPDDDDTKAKTDVDDLSAEIYAECNSDHRYKLGCQMCQCLRNNRLVCGNCNEEEDDRGPHSFCEGARVGQVFSRDCNFCHCDKDGYAYCTAKKCLKYKNIVVPKKEISDDVSDTDGVFDHENCLPGRRYRNGCNYCYCIKKGGVKLFGCTKKRCDSDSEDVSIASSGCVKGTSYEINCLICYCVDILGVSTELCSENPECKLKRAKMSPVDLDSLHGYCEPRHTYKKDCNICTCMPDGQSVKCTSNDCEAAQEPVSVEIVPVIQKGSCARGLSFKIDCNYCFCLSNGNAICTTIDCRRHRS